MDSYLLSADKHFLSWADEKSCAKSFYGKCLISSGCRVTQRRESRCFANHFTKRAEFFDHLRQSFVHMDVLTKPAAIES